MRSVILWGWAACAHPSEPPPLEPEPISSPEPQMHPEPDLPETALLQIHVAETGYVLRLYRDGRFTEAWPSIAEAERAPFDVWAPGSGQQQLDALQQRWLAAVAAMGEGPHGPVIPPGSPVPGGGRLKAVRIAVAVRGPEGVVRTVVQGDLRVSESLGPLEEPFGALTRQVHGPRQ